MREFPPLLTTSAIEPGDVPFLRMKDTDKRLEAHLKAIMYWKNNFPNLKIVVVDGTNFDLSPFLPEDIECLHFLNNENLIKERGKGYGEAKIVEYGLKNSIFLKKTQNFMKITGKRWIENLDQFSNDDLFTKFKCKPVITNRLNLLYVQSGFFCAEKDFYLDKFANLEMEINEFEEDLGDIEEAMARIINRNGLKNYVFSVVPEFKGWDGTANIKVDIYKKNFRHKLRRLKYKLLSKVL